MRPGLVLVRASEARRRLAAAIRAVGREAVPLSEAAGRVLAEPLLATEDVPGFPRALMDGFAVRAADTQGAGEGAPIRLRVVGGVAIGEAPTHAVAAGEALAVATGAHLPAGADAVVPWEHTRSAGDAAIDVARPADPGRNVIHAGEDLGKGSLVIPSGRRLRAPEIAALATFGVVSVSVFQRPRVAVLSTGSELCRVEEHPAAAKVRDVNQHALAAEATLAGARVTRAGIVPDEPVALERALRGLLPAHDVLLLSGGSSIGGKDFTGDVVQALGAQLLFHGVDVRPGKPTLAASVGDKLLLGLPGVPTSALVIFGAFARPVLWRMGGELVRDPWPVRCPARLARPLGSVRGREDYVRVRLEDRDGALWAEPLPGGAAALSGLVGADGLVIVPEDAEGLEAGAPVEVCRL